VHVGQAVLDRLEAADRPSNWTRCPAYSTVISRLFAAVPTCSAASADNANRFTRVSSYGPSGFCGSPTATVARFRDSSMVVRGVMSTCRAHLVEHAVSADQENFGSMAVQHVLFGLRAPGRHSAGRDVRQEPVHASVFPVARTASAAMAVPSRATGARVRPSCSRTICQLGEGGAAAAVLLGIARPGAPIAHRVGHRSSGPLASSLATVSWRASCSSVSHIAPPSAACGGMPRCPRP